MNTVRYPGWFAEQGHTITVACLAGSPLEKKALEMGMSVVVVPKARRYFDFYKARKLAAIIRQSKVDVVWFRDNRDMDLLAWTKRYCKGSFRLIYHQAMQLSKPKKDLIHSWRFSQLDAWITLLGYLSKQVRNYTKFPEERIHEIPLGQEIPALLPTQEQARRALDLPNEVFTAGIVGRLDPMKGQALLMQAAALLWEQGIELHLLFVGEPTRELGADYQKHIENEAAMLPHPERIHFRSYTEDVAQAYCALDVFVMASDGETFGNVTIEALLCGICVLGSNASGTPELLDHGQAGVLFESKNAAALASGLAELANSPEQRGRLAKRGQEHAHNRYTKGAVLKQLSQVLRP